MYDHLETNIPHTMMAFSTDDSLIDEQLFPSRESVLRYLERYAEPVLSLCKFKTKVISVTPNPETLQDTWILQSIDLESSEVKNSIYEAIVFASGHYAVPHVPAISGLEAWNAAYPNTVSHSKYYRNPKPYTALKTVIVGASASGLDISAQIATVCAKPLLLSQRTAWELAGGVSQENIHVMPEIREFLSPSSGYDRAVRFTNGRIEVGIEKVLFCTGYYHSYPFLSAITPPVITSGHMVEHLYQHIFYTPNPTLAFVGVPSKVLPFRTCEAQGAVIAGAWAGRLAIPSSAKMEAWIVERITKKGSSRRFHELKFPEDLDYLNEMVAWALQASENGEIEGMLPQKWRECDYWARERFAGIKRAFAAKGESRREIRRMEDLGYEFAK